MCRFGKTDLSQTCTQEWLDQIYFCLECFHWTSCDRGQKWHPSLQAKGVQVTRDVWHKSLVFVCAVKGAKNAQWVLSEPQKAGFAMQMKTVNYDDLFWDFNSLSTRSNGRIWTSLLLENPWHICSNVKRSASGVQFNWFGLRTVIFKILSVMSCFHKGLIFIFSISFFHDEMLLYLPIQVTKLH